ncbi:MAG: hypothetical protein KF800_14850 [Lysobacter sp.]|nr:hypothetical protein [Lysobacter sp.]
MWEFVKENQFVVGALSGSLAAYLLGLLVSYFRREKRWLGYSISARRIAQGGLGKLALTYDGVNIDCADSCTVIFRNIGNRPLKSIPVKIIPHKSGVIIDHELKLPKGASFDVNADGQDFTVNVDLLNPGEAFTVGLTIVDGVSPDAVNVVARAELLEVREIGIRADTVDLIEAMVSDFPFGRIYLDLFKLVRRI